VVRFTLRPLNPGERAPPYPLDKGLSGSESRHGCGDEKKSHQCPHRELNPAGSARNLISVLNELSQLLFILMFEKIFYIVDNENNHNLYTID
jgi:hypothetical protein